MTKINPEDARMLVRDRTYKNRAEEDVAVRSVDQQIWDKVRTLEQFMIQQSDDLNEQRQGAIADALAVSEELRTLKADVDRKRVRLEPATARRWQILEQRAKEAAEALDRIDRDVDHVAEKLSDPYATYQALVDRFSILKPDIHL